MAEHPGNSNQIIQSTAEGGIALISSTFILWSSEDNMSNQFDFDFGDNTTVVFIEHPAGTWNDHALTTEQYHNLFAKADAALHRISTPLRAMFEAGINVAKAQHVAMLARISYDDCEAYRLWRTNFELPQEDLAAFISDCFANAGKSTDGIERKTRRKMGTSIAAMFVPDLGTLIVYQWESGHPSIDYRPWRTEFFLESYHDDMQTICAPCASWAGAYCADKIANSNDGIASVPTFILNGREYINGGGMSVRTYHDCRGWTFRPLADWAGPTYSYRRQCRAWDDGRLERGDRRGLVVRVRGQLCVLDSAVIVYDDNVTNSVHAAADEDDDTLPKDFEGAIDDFDELAV